MVTTKDLFTFLFAMVITLCLFENSVPNVCAQPELTVRNINTGLSYASIQEAINANETLDGHTINVYPRVYYEQVVVNKSLSLIGQDRDNTIIDANASETAIYVTAQNVRIFGFTVQNTTSGYGAIQLYYTENNTITNNVVRNTYYGIYIYNSRNNTITNNYSYNNSYCGSYLYFSADNTISECEFSDNINAGVYLYNSEGNLVSRNNVSRQKFGITFSDSSNDTVCDNRVSATESGIRATTSSELLICRNNISNCENGISIIDSSNINILNNTLSTNTANGIRLESSSGNLFSNNAAMYNTQSGISLSLSNTTTIQNNAASANENGIRLSKSSNCTIEENDLTQNSHGITLSESVQNTLWHNNVQENQRGLNFTSSNNNTISNNNFLNNTQQLTSLNSTNQLDNGSEGNYWSNYNGTDADGDAIGDTPYVLAQNNTDNYPLMGQFYHFTVQAEEKFDITAICSSTILELQYDSEVNIMDFNVSATNSTTGLCRVQVPKILINSPNVVLVDGEKVNSTTLPISNLTHSQIYFTYTPTTHQITIVSESYYDLLQRYNTLLIEYQNLNSTYQQLLADYNELAGNYSVLHDNYNTLNLTYNQLTDNYETLQNNYNILLTLYDSLNSNYTSLLTSFEELTSKYNAAANEIDNLRNLTYATLATVIAIASILTLTTFRYHRKVTIQDKIIQAYNPLDKARTLFKLDVESRSDKIGKFESKYGVKIQPRNTLEEVLKNLEKERKKNN
jgi:parallel beta-helix repeat protein